MSVSSHTGDRINKIHMIDKIVSLGTFSYHYAVIPVTCNQDNSID